MKNLIFLACALCAVQAVPVPSAEQPNELEILQIPLQGNKELDIVSLADDDGKINDRNKRTIGILRELFPELSKIVEQKIQMLIPFVLRTVGPILLRSGIGGLGGAGTNSSPSFDDDDDEDDKGKEAKDDNTISGANGRKVSISLPTFPPDDDDEEEEEENNEKQSQVKNDQGTSSTNNIPSIVVSSTPVPLNPSIDLSVFDAEPSSSSSTTTSTTPSSSNGDESSDDGPAILDKIDLRQNDSPYLATAPYVYELPPHNPDNESKDDEFNSIR